MKRGVIITLLLHALYASAAIPADRVDVEVVCELAEHRYRIGLTDQQADQIESHCAQQLAALLGDRITFLEFTAGSQHSNQLIVRVGKSAAEADPDAFRAVTMDIALQGDDVTESGDPVSWTFRTLDEYLKVPPPAAFAEAIVQRFADELQQNEAHLVKAQLAHIAIAESAFPLPQDQTWLLPFARGDLGVADDSEFSIKAELRTPTSRERFTYAVALIGDFTSASNVPAEFHNKVKALHLGDDRLPQVPSIQRLQSAESITVLQVSVTRYVPAAKPGRTTPSALRVE